MLLRGNGKTMAMMENEQLEQLIQPAEQMADDDWRLAQARGLIRIPRWDWREHDQGGNPIQNTSYEAFLTRMREAEAMYLRPASWAMRTASAIG